MDNWSDKNWQNNLNSLEVAPPADAWSNIEKQLGSNKRPAAFYYTRGTAAIFLIAISLIAGYNLGVNNTEQSSNFTEVNKNSNQQGVPAQAASLKAENLTEPLVKTETTSGKITTAPLQKTTLKNPTTNEKVDEFDKTSSKKPSDLKLKETKPVKWKQTIPQQPVITETSGHHSPSVEAFNLKKFEVTKLEFKSVALTNKIPENITPNASLKYATKHTWLKNIEVSAFYAPIFAINEIMSSSQIPINASLVQQNLQQQKITGVKNDYKFSNQFALHIGYKIAPKLSVISGIEYSQWQGSADVYVQNVYEIENTITREHVSEEVIKEISNQSLSGKLNSQNLNYIIGNPGGGVDINYIGVGLDTISKNKPKTREITKTITTVTNEQVTIIEDVEYQDTVKTEFTQSYFEIPIMLQYSTSFSRFKINIGAGTSAILGSKTQFSSVAISQQNRQSNNTVGVPSFQQWQGIVSVGLGYGLTENVQLKLQPFGKFGISNQIKNRQYFGVNMGAAYTF